jgi:hypothetical protein
MLLIQVLKYFCLQRMFTSEAELLFPGKVLVLNGVCGAWAVSCA